MGVRWDKKVGKGAALHQQMGGLSLQPPQPQSGPSKAKKQPVKKSSNLFMNTFTSKGGKKGGDENEGRDGVKR